MQLRSYMGLAAAAFLIATTGGDIVARTTIAGNTLNQAFMEHLDWASVTVTGVFLLFIPFAGAAFIGFQLQKFGKTINVFIIFLLSMTILIYFYFNGFADAQRAVLERQWTAATFSVGLLPFFVGLPLLLAMQVGGRMILQFIKRLED